MAQSPLSKAQYVVDRLREELRDGTITPGSPLIQVELAERYGVSATPVREAMRALEAEGVIVYSPHRGATVRELPQDDVEDIYRLRAEIEGLATQLAVQRMTEAAMIEITRAYKELNNADPAAGPERWRLNREFHLAICRAGSRVAAAQAESLWSHFPSRITIWADPSTAQNLVDDHELLMAALLNRDAEGARKAMSDHVLHALALRRAL